jgi:transcription elongation factor GreA
VAGTFLTRAGLEKLRRDHADLLRRKHELTNEVSAAAAHGDLRENAEYHAAREQLQRVAARLAELDGKLTHVQLIEELDIKADEARLGSRIVLEDAQTKERMTYDLVGADEANPAEGKLSIDSPMGKALLGKKAGERFTLTLPRASVVYRIVTIERTA